MPSQHPPPTQSRIIQNPLIISYPLIHLPLTFRLNQPHRINLKQNSRQQANQYLKAPKPNQSHRAIIIKANLPATYRLGVTSEFCLVVVEEFFAYDDDYEESEGEDVGEPDLAE